MLHDDPTARTSTIRFATSRRALLRAAVAIAAPWTAAPLAAQDAAVATAAEPDAVAGALARATAALDAIALIPEAERTYDNTVRAVDDAQFHAFVDTRPVTFLAYVSTDADERERGRRASSEVSSWFDRLYQREDVYRALRAYAGSGPEIAGEERRYLDVLLRDFRRAGMELPPEARARLLAIEGELTELGIEFQKNIDEDESVLLVTPEECPGIPQDFLDSLQQYAGLYVLEMKGAAPNYVFGLCEDQDTRRKMSITYGRRGGTRNVEVLERMLELRAEKARLLGYENIAAFVTETRMAQVPARVWAFYDDLRPKLRRKATDDFNLLQGAKRAHLGDLEETLQAWDFTFYENYLLREKYAVDSEKVREYFPVEQVTRGIFELTQELFGLEYRDVTEGAREEGRPLWHEDVRLYEVQDVATGELLGEFYTDLHPRPGKYSHAAQFPLRPRKRWAAGSLSKPLVALVCNFTKPTATKPALLTHDEVETYLHEFGHCLHSILTEANLYEFSGTSVARDFVEAPSQMLENWIWDAGVLARFARHYSTGEPLPEEMLEGMLAARNLGSGLAAEAQVFLGVLDFTYHTDPDGVVDTTAVRERIYAETRMFPPVEGLYGQASFGHLVGYHAGYYGYLWSLVYAQDMFSRFEEAGAMDRDTAREYREKVLAKGGTEDALDLVRSFLGREPNADAFLRHLGLE